MKAKHLIVISIDAMVTEDIEYARTLPSFKRIIDGASIIKNVKTIYPTLTHPVHASIISGAAAGATGVVNNILFDREDPTAAKVWFNDLSQIRCDTIIHAAKRAGLTVAVSNWPMTSYGRDFIDYLFPNALDFYFEGREDSPLDVYRSLGASEDIIDVIAEGVEKFGFADKHPEVDYFQFHCAAQIIKRYKPSLLLMHPGNVDAYRHKCGVWGEHINKALREIDEMLGDLLSALEEAEILEDTDIVLLSDHGQIGITRTISPNVFLKDRGYITLADDGSLADWRAFVKSAGASAQVYLKDPTDKALYDEVYSMLSRMASEGIYGFEKVYTAGELKEKYSYHGDFSFVLETDGYTAFSERISGSAVVNFDPGNYSVGRGKHGHAPEKGPQPIFIANGPSFKSGVILECGDILNHAPTLASALGVTVRGVTGHSVNEILE